MTIAYETMAAHEIAAAVVEGKVTARAIVEACLVRIAQQNSKLNAFTKVVSERALTRADAIDARRRLGGQLGPLAGVPFSVKNLFDVEEVVTLAGSKINADNLPAGADATLVRKLEAADAILVGSLNMGEYAYDFTGENAHYGASRNPHDPERMAGGSSGGSGTAVASGMTPIALGSDTNGSIRVPSSLCGLFGLKPTYGRLSRFGTYPFVSAFDHLGPMARSVMDLALAYEAMQGRDTADHAQNDRPVEPVIPTLAKGLDGLRVARATGYFDKGGEPEAHSAVDIVTATLGATMGIDIPEAGRGRAAAFLITMAEGASLHLDRVRKRQDDFDPEVKDRLIAGAMVPAAWINQAQKFRTWYRAQVLKLFETVDVIIAPATPCFAPRLGQKMMTLAGVDMPVRANLGMFTQPFSFIGLPVAAVPIWLEGAQLPIGVQIVAAPWREDIVLRVAQHLEAAGIARAPLAKA
ncbi:MULTISPECIES: AtzE family amidohydrolase [unclassified Beijerinckia]|uniref:AtzE family amidohydrolase n=1 Tax=unclassified Beijerinckia TaxID=2638183 RepID=UPI00089B7DCD|nr:MULTISPECIES: AtzE family amidohydrolase [unclassified Beijerinckia]MDH7799768.1 AtzE family amidohydrolase [Beijerinckia sp. GAS462]SED36672.1 aspartyl-tRNA(Asn)/glutamyl-tRNA(Gln) amidotransferase subunit A [Beijerinckia sp. 28-YEA-48]